MKLLDLVRGRELDALADPADIITTSAFWPTGANVLATGTDRGTIKLWNLTTKQLLGTLQGHTNSIHSLAFSINGTLLACITETTLTLWDVETRTSLWTRTTAWWAGALFFAPD